jgi:hypothetical protein
MNSRSQSKHKFGTKIPFEKGLVGDQSKKNARNCKWAFDGTDWQVGE